MTPETAWSLLVSEPVAILATIDSDGSPHLVPFTFAPLDDRRVVSAVDEKPKRSPRLRRLANIERDPRVTLLAHHYENDWERLWWVRATGTATITDDPGAQAQEALVRRYPAYREHALSPWLIIDVVELRGWSAAPVPD